MKDRKMGELQGENQSQSVHCLTSPLCAKGLIIRDDNLVQVQVQKPHSHLYRGRNSCCSRGWRAGCCWRGGGRGLGPGARHGLRGGGWCYGGLNGRAWSHFRSWSLCPFQPLLLTSDTVGTRSLRHPSYNFCHRAPNNMQYIQRSHTQGLKVRLVV